MPKNTEILGVLFVILLLYDCGSPWWVCFLGVFGRVGVLLIWSLMMVSLFFICKIVQVGNAFLAW